MQQFPGDAVGQEDVGPFGTIGTPTIVSNEAKPGEVMLIDPHHSGLGYGPSHPPDIQFGPKGGFRDYVWIGSGEHPLLDALLTAYPDIQIVDPGPRREIMCPMDKEIFKSQAAFDRHAAKMHSGPRPNVELPATRPTAVADIVLAGVEDVSLGDELERELVGANAADEG